MENLPPFELSVITYNLYEILLRWRYSPGWVLASFTICLQASRSLTLTLHSFIPIFLRYVDMSSNHLIFGLPLHQLSPSSFLAAAWSERSRCQMSNP